MKFIVDKNIPFIEGRLEPWGEVEYLAGKDIGREAAATADALVIRTRTHCDASLLRGSKAKAVVTATIGMDHIDVDWCRDNGVIVRNAPGCNAPAVAQYVWASILSLGLDPAGLRVGVVGNGNVGSKVTDWGRKLGAEVWVNDPPQQESGKPGDYHELDEILAGCDVVTLHTPLTFSGKHRTFHLIGESELELLSRRECGSPLLINASRGEVVDTAALTNILQTEKLDAVLDTWENEPDISSQLVSLAKIATPHIAGYSLEGKQRATRMVLETLDDIFGFETDKSGLSGDYQVPPVVTPKAIMDSYNPLADSTRLKSAPADFERLRQEYVYRMETNF